MIIRELFNNMAVVEDLFSRHWVRGTGRRGMVRFPWERGELPRTFRPAGSHQALSSHRSLHHSPPPLHYKCASRNRFKTFLSNTGGVKLKWRVYSILGLILAVL